ncbi:hypothetical protein F5878DRAFT_647181 [Lentinula raphanica]|uniref:Uncharacterized protein n=1 Tax=Lentinula raphanica TaxID=153919 RepID=A0AA38U412_9AGAR|nr:hypothetical protein F5878DRAFT_647181 [Lentinula raphanica]
MFDVWSDQYKGVGGPYVYTLMLPYNTYIYILLVLFKVPGVPNGYRVPDISQYTSGKMFQAQGTQRYPPILMHFEAAQSAQCSSKLLKDPQRSSKILKDTSKNLENLGNQKYRAQTNIIEYAINEFRLKNTK